MTVTQPNDSGRPRDGRGLDPTRMANQPALRNSSGAIWLVMGAFFLAASAVPLGALGFIREGSSENLARVLLVAVVVLYVAMVVIRIVVKDRVTRLRTMAGCFLTMAATALLGLIGCAFLERGTMLGALGLL